MRILIAVATAFALTACNAASGSDGVEGTAATNGEGMEFAVRDFDEVTLAGPDNAEVSIGDGFSVRAEGDAEALTDLEITVRGNVLHIGRKSDGFLGRGNNGRATIYITMPTIRGADLAGSGDMTVAAAVAERFDASLAGSGNLSFSSLEATHVEFDLAGSGDIRAAGSATDIEINIAGSGGVEIEDLRASTMDVSIAGSGDVSGFATERVEASLLGSGDVRVSGGAECDYNALGSGELTCS